MSRLARDLLSYYRREFPEHHACQVVCGISNPAGRRADGLQSPIQQLDLDRGAQ